MTITGILPLLAPVSLAYLAGSLPFGLWVGLIARGIDIREHGSRNIGATNALRVLGKPLGALVFALDTAKGWAPTALAPGLAAYVAAALSEPHAGPLSELLTTPQVQVKAPVAVLAALAAVLGHVFPITLRFRGGKGVATGAGALLGVTPFSTVTALAGFTLVVAATRYVSLGSVVAALLLPGVAWWRGEPGSTLAVAGAISLVVLVRHRGNLVRLARGQEPKLGEVKPGGGASDGARSAATREGSPAKEAPPPP